MTDFTCESNDGDLWTMKPEVPVDNFVEDEIDKLEPDTKSISKEISTNEDDDLVRIVMKGARSVKDEDDPNLLDAVMKCTFVSRDIDSSARYYFTNTSSFLKIFIRICKYKCPLCDFVYERRETCVTHVVQEHPNWREDLPSKFFVNSQNVNYNNL